MQTPSPSPRSQQRSLDQEKRSMLLLRSHLPRPHPQQSLIPTRMNDGENHHYHQRAWKESSDVDQTLPGWNPRPAHQLVLTPQLLTYVHLRLRL